MKVLNTEHKLIKEGFEKIGEGFHKLERITGKEWIRLNFLAILVGIICGYAALGFRYLIGIIQNFIFNREFDINLISPIDHSFGVWIIFFPVIGILLSSIITRFLAREASGHGVPEVIEAILTKAGKIKKRIVFVKALASSLTIAFGGSVGREGPIIQIGSAAGSAIGQILQLRTKLIKILVSCGAAGALAATFNTPIAGVVFAIEIILLEFRTKSFVPLVISTVFATVISRYYLGNEPAFIVPPYSFVNPMELFFYLGLGIVSGIIGMLVIKVLYGTEDIFDSINIPFYFKAILGGLLVGLIGYFFPQIFGVGYHSVSGVLQQNSTFVLMLVLIFIKIIAMSLTIAAGGSGGIFAPSLFIGAMVGGAYGWLINSAFPDFSAGYGAYALVGMAAVFSATSRATLTAIVILFEMTLDYSIILPLMFVCVVADQTAWMFAKDTIYSLKLKRKGLQLVTDFGVDILAVTQIKDIMTSPLKLLYENMVLEDALKEIFHDTYALYPLIDDKGYFTGMVSQKTLLETPTEADNILYLKDLKEPSFCVASPEDTVITALKKMKPGRDPRIIILDKTKKPIGIVSPTDLVRLSSQSIKEEQDQDQN